MDKFNVECLTPDDSFFVMAKDIDEAIEKVEERIGDSLDVTSWSSVSAKCVSRKIMDSYDISKDKG